MFVNDLSGLCRTNTIGDYTNQIPMGFQTWGNPYTFGLGYNVAGSVINPNFLYGRIPQTIPQTLMHQGFVPQVVHGFVPQNFGHLNTITHNPFMFAQNVPFTPNTIGANVPFTGVQFCGTNPHTTGIVGNQIGYGFNPYAALCNWNWNVPQTLQGNFGFQNTTCR